MKRCKFCQMGTDGKYSVAEFQNPEIEEQHVAVGVYEGLLTIRFELEGAPITLETEINYCPVCGRKYEEREKRPC